MPRAAFLDWQAKYMAAEGIDVVLGHGSGGKIDDLFQMDAGETMHLKGEKGPRSMGLACRCCRSYKVDRVCLVCCCKVQASA